MCETRESLEDKYLQSDSCPCNFKCLCVTRSVTVISTRSNKSSFIHTTKNTREGVSDNLLIAVDGGRDESHGKDSTTK